MILKNHVIISFLLNLLFLKFSYFYFAYFFLLIVLFVASHQLFFLKNEVQLIYITVFALSVQPSDSMFLGTLLHWKLLPNNGCISLCCTLYPCTLFTVIHSGLYLLIPYPYLASPTSTFPISSLYLWICFSFTDNIIF